MTIVIPSLVGVKAAQVPNPMKGGRVLPSTVTFTSVRGNPTLKTVWSLFQAPFAPVHFSMDTVSILLSSAFNNPGQTSARANTPIQNFLIFFLLYDFFKK